MHSASVEAAVGGETGIRAPSEMDFFPAECCCKMAQKVSSDYEGLTPNLTLGSDALPKKKKKCFETSKLTFFAMLARGRRRIQNRGAALMIIYLTEGWSFSFYCKAQDKHFLAPLKNKETDDRNK